MLIFSPFSLFLTLLLALPALSSSQAQAEVSLDRIEKNTLYFTSSTPSVLAPSPLKTGLQDVQFIGWVRAEGTSTVPHVLLAARSCSDCKLATDERSLYLLAASGGGAFTTGPAVNSPLAMVFPGKILDPKTKDLLFISRAFIGKCLKSQPGEVYVSFQKEKLDRKPSLQSGVFVAQPSATGIHEQLLERRLPSINDTLVRVRLKQCVEVMGRNRVMSSKALDLNLRRNEKADSSSETPDD